MAKRQVMQMDFCGHYKVILDTEAKRNPYKIIAVTWDGHQKTVQKYTDMESVMWYLTDIVRNNSKGEFMNFGHYRIKVVKGFASGAECLAQKVGRTARSITSAAPMVTP